MKYFVANKIVERSEDMSNFPAYKPLTKEQEKFYAKHPDATIDEVKKCEIYVAPPFDLDGYKEEKIAILKQLDLVRRERLCPAYKRIEAEISLKSTGVKVLELERSQEIIDNDNRVFSALRAERHRIEDLINAATDKDGVDSAFDSNILNVIQ